MKKKWWQVLTVIVCVCALCVCAHFVPGGTVEIVDDPIALEGKLGILIQPMDSDINVIPDKYNTGAKGELTTVEIGSTVNGIQFKAGSNNTRNVLDFANRNKSISGTVVFENYDFSKYIFASYNEDLVDRNIKISFKNCRFSTITVGKERGNLFFEFENCSIEGFYGSNASFKDCQFGKSYLDCIVPYQNVEVSNCFFSDMGSKAASGKELHSDGTQLYGANGIDVEDVAFNNCRFEIPPLRVEGSTAYVNACIMLQMEYSNARNVWFSDCIVNGGGYSIYAWDKNKGYTFENVKFEGIRSGCAKQYGTIYPRVDRSIQFYDVEETNSLYIGSVWKKNGETHLSVTNDTNQERRLIVFTDDGTFEYVIPACMNGSEMSSSVTYSDLPFDIDITIPGDCGYLVCYDNTLEGYAKQLRFVNWSGKDVYLKKAVFESLISGQDDVLISGECGADVEYLLTKAGILTLRGSGSTENYNSGKLAPWIEWADYVREVKVEEGIERLGNQLFRNCDSIKSVSLPDSLLTIGTRAFAGCSSITSATIPKNIQNINDSAFTGTILQEVMYEGSNWNSITLGSGNDILTEKLVLVSDVEEEGAKIVLQGECGAQITFELSDDGILKLKGKGSTYNYSSGKVAPWYDCREQIKSVVVESGIEVLGTQVFRKCNNLESVELPDTLQVIGNNAFISCVDLKTIDIPNSIEKIGRYAFAGISEVQAVYEGTQTEWEQVSVGTNNGSLTVNVSSQ